MKVAVVGAGIVGLSAARFLAKRGHRVVLFEQYPLFHDKGSSHGHSRIIRRAYPDPFYTACMVEAYPLWQDLEHEADTPMVHEVGLLYFGANDSGRMLTMRDGLEECNVNYTVFEPRDMHHLILELRVKRNEAGIFTPEAGWVDAHLALQKTLQLAVAHGTEVRAPEKAVLEDLERNYDAFVVAPGAWIGDFVQAPVRITVETFGYLPVQVKGPVWIDDTDLGYGFPSSHFGLKMGIHMSGYTIEPHDETREPARGAMHRLQEKAEARFGIQEPMQHWKGCVYTTTPSEDFLLGRIGHTGFFASACSGHGFKFGPWTGKLLADFVDGKDKPENHPHFRWPKEQPMDDPVLLHPRP